MTPNRDKRIIAVSVDWQSLGFAVFESPHELTDWGTRNFRRSLDGAKHYLESKLAFLLHEHQPDVLVLVTPTTSKREKTAARITKLARAKLVSVAQVPSDSIRKAFHPVNGNKYHIAAAIAERYPELLAQLPTPRKDWQSEKFGITIFEAAAAGFVYYGQTITPPES